MESEASTSMMSHLNNDKAEEFHGKGNGKGKGIGNETMDTTTTTTTTVVVNNGGEKKCEIRTNDKLLHLLEYDPHHRRNLFNEKYLINFMDIMADDCGCLHHHHHQQHHLQQHQPHSVEEENCCGADHLVEHLNHHSHAHPHSHPHPHPHHCQLQLEKPSEFHDVDDDEEGEHLFEEVAMMLRKRRGWTAADTLCTNELDLLGDDDDVLAEEEDDAGCPLPSTPEDTQLIEAEMTEVLKAGVLSDEIDLGALAHNAAEQAEEFVRKVWEASWKVCHYKNLPKWLQDNDFLHRGHRPPLPSFSACFKSIFRLHTETGNIWTHLLGCVAFIGVACYFLSRPSVEIQVQEKLIFGAFFAGAIICLGFSFAFHTLSCHSVEIGRLFSKLDYCGIALLIMGSFVPWLYYGFYCHYQPKVIYLSVVCVLGCLSIIVSLWDKFSEPALRPLRAGVFMSFGLSGIIPAIHYGIMEGWFSQISQSSLGWLCLMGLLYILGALLYALRVPERWFPGKFDIWFQSHQLFHILVIAAAFVHYHGISEMAMYRVTVGECTVPHEPITF